jgi:hypothetical protein
MIGPDVDGPPPHIWIVEIPSDQQYACAPGHAFQPLVVNGTVGADQDQRCGLPAARSRRSPEGHLRFGAGRGAQPQQVVEKHFVLGDDQRSALSIGGRSPPAGCGGFSHVRFPSLVSLAPAASAARRLATEWSETWKTDDLE